MLLAPGRRIPENLIRKSGDPRLQEWREQGRRAFFHAAWKREEWLSYDFWEDIQRYPDHALQCQLPTLLIHGRDDDTIPLRHAVDFAASRPWIDLRAPIPTTC
jgi:pimeloyl-ACP methyl ester carboxylesterase